MTIGWSQTQFQKEYHLALIEVIIQLVPCTPAIFSNGGGEITPACRPPASAPETLVLYRCDLTVAEMIVCRKGRWWSLSDRDVPGAAEWCAGHRRFLASGWRNSAGGVRMNPVLKTSRWAARWHAYHTALGVMG